MAKIGGFDPGLGVTALRDGRREIGRANLPASTRVIPDSEMQQTTALLFGKLSDSGLMERFSSYLAVEPRFRELLSPDVFFESLAGALEAFRRESEGRPQEGPLVAAAKRLAEILADKELCDMLRNLIVKA